MPLDERVLARFSGDNAAAYDQRIVRLIPGYETLHTLACGVLPSRVPLNGRVLVVGAGTGTEIAGMAAIRPDLAFTAVEPSVDMIAQAMRKPELMDVIDRIEWHPDTIETLDAPAHDGACCLLVSHFLHSPENKAALYGAIRARLSADATLVFADLCGKPGTALFERQLALWADWTRALGLSEEATRARLESVRQEVNFLSEADLLSLVQRTGFAEPTRLFWGIAAGCWSVTAA